MPRRTTPDALGARIGARIRELRKEAGLTLEKLAYELDVGPGRHGSKGYVSDIEKGYAVPSVATLTLIAERLGVHLLDLVTFPADDDRQKLVDRTRRFSKGTLRRFLKETNPTK